MNALVASEVDVVSKESEEHVQIEGVVQDECCAMPVIKLHTKGVLWD